MLEALILTVGVSLIVVVLVGIAVWFAVTSAGGSIWAERRTLTRVSGPWFLRGTDLFYWARDRAAQVVAKHMSSEPTAATPIKLAAELHAEATRAMLPFDFEHEVDIDLIPCPEEGQGMIGVTAPEALEIADFIERNLPAVQRERIHDLARRNAAKLANVSERDFDPLQTPCPLQGSGGVCIAYAARPLRCRPLHAATIWQQRGVKKSIDAERDYDERIVEQGAETGCTEALISAGRDGNLYELNSALLVALDTPRAAERWARGEAVFGQCKRYRLEGTKK